MIQLINFIMMMPPSEGSKSNPYQSLIFIALIIVVFYFFMIRPQVKRQKEMKNFRDSLAKGDKIVTTGGIYGKITAINENVITIDIGNNVTIKVDKSAVLKDSSDLQQQQK